MAVFLGQALEDICSGTQRHMAWCFYKVYMEIRCVSYTQCSATSLQAWAATCVVNIIDTASKWNHTSLVERNMARLTKLQLLLLHSPPRLKLLSYNVCQTEIVGCSRTVHLLLCQQTRRQDVSDRLQNRFPTPLGATKRRLIRSEWQASPPVNWRPRSFEIAAPARQGHPQNWLLSKAH